MPIWLVKTLVYFMHVENKRASHLQVHCNPLLTVDRENVRKKINNPYKERLSTLLNAKLHGCM